METVPVRSRYKPDDYVPTDRDLDRLDAYVRRWSGALGVPVKGVRSPEEIKDKALRSQIEKRRRVKGWYDALEDTVSVYLPNIALLNGDQHAALERTLLHETVGHKGLMGILGRERFDEYCDALWAELNDNLRFRALEYVNGSADSLADRRAAAAEFVAHAAEDLAYPERGWAHRRWGFAMKVLMKTVPELKNAGLLEDNELYDSFGKALRFLRTLKKYIPTRKTLDEVSDEVDAAVGKLEPQLRGLERRDYSQPPIKLGRIYPVILNSSERSRDLPMELRMGAFFGSWDDDKQERHPFHASDLKGLVKGLRDPLAVFVSRQKDKPDSTVVLLPQTTDMGGETKHMVAILTPVVNRDGVPVMNIDSIYPKSDASLLYWLKKTYTDKEGNEKPSLLRYAGRGFYSWFMEAWEREKENIDGELETTKSYSERQSNSAEVGVRLTARNEELEKSRADLDRAAKIVVNFKNPMIPGENFRLFYKKDSPLAEEVERIRRRTIEDGTFMKTPDGSPSSLTEDEWLFIHTAAFRSIYGNWEGWALDSMTKKGVFDDRAQRLLSHQMDYFRDGEDTLSRVPEGVLGNRGNAWNNAEKSVSLSLDEERKEHTEKLSQRSARELLQESGRRARLDVEAAMVVRGCGSTDSQSSPADLYDREVSSGKLQESVLEAWARSRDIWHDNLNNYLTDTFGAKKDEGAEAEVWYDKASDTAVKTVSLIYFISPQLALDRVLIHNYISPMSAMTVEGCGRNEHGDFCLLVRQPWIHGESTTEKEVNGFMKNLDAGFRHSGYDTTEYASETFYVGDLHGANALKLPSGDVVIIDTEARLNTPALGKGGKYIIPSTEPRHILTEHLEPKEEDIRTAAESMGLSEGVPKFFFKRESALAEEVNSLKRRTIEDGTFMTAPDGTPTQLSEQEWLFAHTSVFRKFYGDWEGHLLDEEIRKNGINSVSLHLLDNLLAYYEETGEDILERIPPEALRSGVGRDEKAVAASLLVRGDGSTDSSHSLGEQYPELGRQGLRQESTLESWAKKIGIWFDDTDTAFIDNTLQDGGFIGEGNEAKVWLGGNNTVTKAISLRNYVSPQHALDRILLHNYHFPESHMEVTGFGRDSRGNFQIVVSQPFVRGERMTFSEINAFVRSIGFGPAGRHHEPRERQNALLTTAHTTDRYFLGDLHLANVINADGIPIVIDSEMRLNTPGLGYGGRYVIPERKASFSLTEKKEPKSFDVQKAAYALGLTEDFRNIYFAKDEEDTESFSFETEKNTPVRYYSGNISPEPNIVFVFGSNPEGRHGAGAAKIAREQFGAVYGQGEGLQGNAYAIPTKDLSIARRSGIYSVSDSRWEELKRTVLEAYASRGGDYSTLFTRNPYPRSITPEAIVASIVKMYGIAAASPERSFAVAYTNRETDFSLNGYCGGEMAAMFEEAGRRFGRIPANVVFSENWKELIHPETIKTKDTMPDMNDNEYRNLVNDLAIEISVGGDRFSLSDFAARFAAVVPDDRTTFFREAVRRRYLEITPESLHDEKGMKFLDEQLSLWCSDEQYELGVGMNNIKFDPNDDYSELNTVEIFRYVSPGVIQGIWRGDEEGTWKTALFSMDGKRLHEGYIPVGKSGNGYEIVGHVLTATARVYDGKNDGSECFHDEPVRVDSNTGRIMENNETKKQNIMPHETENKNIAPQVRSVGLGRKSAREFFSQIPRGTTVVIDTRNYLQDKNLPQFWQTSMRRTLSSMGVRYELHKELSGRPAEPSETNLGDGKARKSVKPLLSQVTSPDRPDVIDYEKYAATPEFRAGIESIRQMIADGEKVLLVGSEADPARSVVTKLIGQALLEDNIHVQHIDSVDGKIRVRYQDEVVQDAMRGAVLLNGGPRNVHFASDGSYRVDQGVNVRLRDGSSPAEDRLIDDNTLDNYANPVQFSQSAGGKAQALKENAEQSDLTLYVNLGRPGKEAKIGYDAAPRHARVRMNIYTDDRDELLSDEFINAKAELLARHMDRNLYERQLRNVADPESFKINVVGPDMPHISSRFVEGAVSREEMEGRSNADAFSSRGIDHTGYKLDDISGISQEDVNEFIYRTIERSLRIANAPKENKEFEEGVKSAWKTPQFRVSEIVTDGNTGVAEAATIAAQRLGVNATVNAANGWRLMYDNESLYGMEVKDEAMFKNRFRQGLREESRLSREFEYMRNADDDGFRTGLTDVQVLTLRSLGYSNTDIVDMVDIADQNQTVINSPESFAEFLELCTGYGISGADKITVDMIRDRTEYSVDLIRRSLEKGINLTTIVSPDYPSGLRAFKDYDVSDATPVYAVKNGVLSASMEGTRARLTRPAILWTRGDRSVLESPSVGLVGGGRWSDEEARQASAELGSALAEQDIALIASNYDGPQRSAVEEALKKDGKIALVSNAPIGDEETSDAEQNIVEKGGVVVSENSIDDKKGQRDRQSRRRGSALSSALGATAAIVDHVNRLDSTAVGEVSGYVIGGTVLAVLNLSKRKSNEVLDENGKPVAVKDDKSADIEIGRNGEGVEALAATASGKSLDEAQEEALRRSDPQEIAGEAGPLHPDQFTVRVLADPYLEGRRVYFVSENYPDVVEALRRTYGADIDIRDPRQYNAVLREMESLSIPLDGESIELADSAENFGTGIQTPSVKEFSVHYVDGEIYGTLSAPGYTRGLPSQYARAAEYERFQRFREEALRVQGVLLAAVGRDASRPLRFENAFYPVIGDNKVEIWHGKDLAASVSLRPDGSVRVNDIMGDFFAGRKPFLSDKTFAEMVNTMELWVLGAGPDRSEEWSLAEREQREELAKEYEEGYRTLRVDNLDVAREDVEAAIEKGILTPDEEGQKFDRVRAMGLLLKERESRAAELKACTAEVAAQERKVDTLKLAYDNAMNRADSGAKILAAESEYQKAFGELEALREKKTDIARAYGRTWLVEKEIALAEKITKIPGGSDSRFALNVDGMKVTVPNMALSKEAKEEAQKHIDAMLEKRTLSKDIREEIRNVLDEKSGKVLRVADKVDAMKKTPADGRALGTEVVGEFVNGYFTVKREGKMAYADKNMNIVSAWYDRVDPMGLTCGVVYNDKGQINIIRKGDLKEIAPVWLDDIFEPKEGVAVVKSGNHYNYLDMEKGALILTSFKEEVFAFHNGWGVFKQNEDDYVEGKYNYVNRNGEQLNDKGYDRCDDFEEGVATAYSNGEVHQLNENGDDLGIVKMELDDVAAAEAEEQGKGVSLKTPVSRKA